jgi:hypothetical protein
MVGHLRVPKIKGRLLALFVMFFQVSLIFVKAGTLIEEHRIPPSMPHLKRYVRLV